METDRNLGRRMEADGGGWNLMVADGGWWWLMGDDGEIRGLVESVSRRLCLIEVGGGAWMLAEIMVAGGD